MAHYHVANGIAGYGPDCDESTPTYDTLADAIEGAREELSVWEDIARETAEGFADAGDFESAWKEHKRAESLWILRANLDPARKNAPLYRDNPKAYADLLKSQFEDFPHDVSTNSRLYLWECDNEECESEDD
jgi:hypothetical protein